MIAASMWVFQLLQGGKTMRVLCGVAVLVAAVGVLQANPAQDTKAEVKGLHLCCKQCEVSVVGILGKIDGISDVKTDRKSKTVSFAAKDKAAFQKAYDALYNGGFAGTGTFGDTVTARDSAKTEGKVDEVTVKGVHACCNQCIGALNALFKDSKVTVIGKGTQRDVQISGKDLNVGEVLRKLESAGFSGRVAK
jgi:copper chaperone CopZ